MDNLKDLFKQRESFDSFIISGVDDGNMDVVFNNESLVEKIYLNVEAKETGDFDPKLVFNEMKVRIMGIK